MCYIVDTRHEAMDTAPVLPTPEREGSEGDRLAAALGWLWVLSVVILLLKRDSAFVQFHARQGFLVFLVSVLLWTVLAFFGTAGWLLLWLVRLVAFGVIVVGFTAALRGRRWEVPLLGPLAAKLPL